MAINTDIQRIERLAKVIGVSNALLLCGWFPNQVIRIPNTSRDDGHILRKIIGRDGFAALVLAHGGETISIPEVDMTPLRRGGLVHRLTVRGVTAGDIANIAGICPRTVQLVRKQLRLEGFSELSDLLPNDDEVPA
ncbi:MAG: helix-turn-helix domain-containing protein [Azonexaceae bacterium]|nr:helix-turn-helix domain-containing protein [Azonexaceae bacterium]